MDKNIRKAKKNAAQAVVLTASNTMGARSAPVVKAEKRKVKRSIPQAGPLSKDYGQAFVPGKGGFHPSLKLWLNGLESPFTGTPQRCPFNFNPVPSFFSMVGTTVVSRVANDNVQPTAMNQLTFFPGHLPLGQTLAVDFGSTVQAAVADMDEVAYHYQFMQSNSGGGAVITCVGPVAYMDGANLIRQPTAYYQYNGAAGSVSSSVNSASALTTPIGWNATLPIQGDTRFEGHLRCKLLSLGVKIVNTTPELNRGGSIVTVQPSTSMDVLINQAANSIHPSYKDWGPDGCTVTWIPRLRDLSYWHPTSGTSIAGGVITGPIVTSSLEGAGLIIWVNNPTAVVQSYDVEVVAHWELSGYSVQVLSSPGKSTYVSDSVLKGGLAAQSATSATAKGITSTIMAAAGQLEAKAVSIAKAGFQTGVEIARGALH